MQGPGAPTMADDPTGKKSVLTFPNATVATKTVDGPSATITKGYGAMMKNGKLTLASSGALATSLYIAGLVLTAASANQSAEIVTSGLVDPSVLNLGAGVACAVGLDANGKPVRVTDPTCITGLKYVGACDADGAINVAPRTLVQPAITDYGADRTGTVDSTPAITAAITVSTGKVLIPAGIFKHTGITLPAGIILRGESTPCVTGSAAFGNASWATFVSGSVLQNTGSGDSIVLTGSPNTNFGLEDLVLLGSGSGTGHGIKLPSAGGITRPRLSNVLIVNCFVGLSFGIAEDVACYSVHTFGCATGLLFDGPASNDIRLYDWQAGGCTKAASLVDGGGVDFFGGIVQSNTAGIVFEPVTDSKIASVADLNFTRVIGATFASITDNGNFTEIFGVGGDCLINGNLIATDGIRSRTSTLGLQAHGLSHDQFQAKTDGSIALRDPVANVDLLFSFGSGSQRQLFASTCLQLGLTTAGGSTSMSVAFNQYFITGSGNFQLGDPAVFAGVVVEVVLQAAVLTVTFVRFGSEKINGATASLPVTTPWTVYRVRCDGVDWIIDPAV